MILSDDFWRRAAKEGLPWFRFFHCSQMVTVDDLDAKLLDGRLRDDWLQLRQQVQAGDEIWPFEFHVRSNLGMRRGYVLLRKGEPIGGVVTTVS